MKIPEYRKEDILKLSYRVGDPMYLMLHCLVVPKSGAKTVVVVLKPLMKAWTRLGEEHCM